MKSFTATRFLLMLAFLAILIPSISPPSVSAAKKRVRTAVGTGARRAPGVSYSSARLSRPTNSIVVTFLNLANVKRIDYVLSYTASGIAQGVVGSLVPAGKASDSRDLYFGTCSRGACTPHRTIRGATLTVTTTFATGGRHVKRYRIKV